MQRITKVRQQQAPAASKSSSNPFKKVLGSVVKIAGGVVGTAFGGPVGMAIGTAIGSGLDKAIQGGNRNEILGSTINAGISSGVGLVNDRLSDFLPNWKPSTYPNTQIPFPPSQQIFENIVDQGKNVLKAEIEKQIVDDKKFPLQTVPLINLMLRGNFEQRKAMAIQSVATMAPPGVPQAAVQRIISSQNEQELRNNIIQVGKENDINPTAIMYAMDYIL